MHNHKVLKGYLLALKCVTSTIADRLLTSLATTINEVGISMVNCITNALDDASNMSGPYNGLTAKLSELIPNHTHT